MSSAIALARRTSSAHFTYASSRVVWEASQLNGLKAAEKFALVVHAGSDALANICYYCWVALVMRSALPQPGGADGGNAGELGLWRAGLRLARLMHAGAVVWLTLL